MKLPEIYMPTSGMKAWDMDISELGEGLGWNAIWDNITCASKKPK